ncbi:ATP-binding cassette domain-containing protein [Nostocoides sp. F2B08]|uniref:ABC transporter ATP-binding protein n=1 Tax=Nostocoides sp. F2B08 TaxID=2653936 RepID=UPI001263C6FC|nr:ABC transporter ATP-binding protein [Tetrasphaera sp. F2B08]KAB7746174.1 ATP-binding cassette domain-containing protein [Tetrasphaera sp. F2B08]
MTAPRPLTEPPPSGTRRGLRIEVTNLSKHFGPVRAVDDLTFSVEPGRITGFLGPNGAGKTTTLRMLLGLVRPTAGTATIGGRRYAELDDPVGTVGAALEATGFHPGRSGRDHLRVLAAGAGLPDRRVDEMLELTGIPAAANQRAGGYSMGMRQRLGLAAALLGDPEVLILDEPTNGLDPEGIRWLRSFLRHLANEGRSILISSHLLAEVEATVDDIVIITNGRLVRQGAIAQLRGAQKSLVRTSDTDRLIGALRIADVDAEPAEPAEPGAVHALTRDLRLIGDVAMRAGLPVWELRILEDSLESLFFEATEGTSRNLGTADPAAGQDGTQADRPTTATEGGDR